MAYLLGYDVGSSSLKAAVIEIETGRLVALASAPKTEMEISAPRPGWAEQDPEAWWANALAATAEIRDKHGLDLTQVRAIGISYQMHGLVIVDRDQRVLRPSIIWCDSRAVSQGERAFREIGPQRCLDRLLNSPGNFTAAKLAWVKENEPEIYARVYKAMLPGDYLAMKLTGEIRTSYSGLSEGIFWDYRDRGLARIVLDFFGLSPDLIAEAMPTFSRQGEVTKAAAAALGLTPGIPVSYRAGDQPNNALSLNVLEPGELATTAGTSGVVYGVSERPVYDPASRVNTFIHVNHAEDNPRYGVLMCVNGTGILNRWLKDLLGGPQRSVSYEEMNGLAAQAPAGADGLLILPYGNGAERTLANRYPRAIFRGLDFNLHGRPHLLRAAQEGIVFALNYGVEIMKEMGLQIRMVRAGQANMFLSPLFGQVFAAVTGARVELYNTDGAQGAARGAGLGAGIFQDRQAAFRGLQTVRAIDPDPALREKYAQVYGEWRETLGCELER